MLARKVVTPSGRRIRGYFPSRKVGRMVAWESMLERDAILHFELSPQIATYREQPEKVIYYINGEPCIYYPDFEVILTCGEVIHIEVKPKAKLRKKKLQDKLTAIEAHYSRLCRVFRILTEQEIRVEPRLGNLKLLAYHNRQGDISDADLQSWRQHLEKKLPSTIAEAQEALGGDIKKVYRLIAAGYLTCDVDSEIGPASKIAFTKEGAQNASFCI